MLNKKLKSYKVKLPVSKQSNGIVFCPIKSSPIAWSSNTTKRTNAKLPSWTQNSNVSSNIALYPDALPAGAVTVRCSAQSTGIPWISTTTYGSIVSPFETDPLGFGNCCALTIFSRSI